jgi:hypothetical protein
MPRRLGEIVRLPELIASVIGFVGALVWLRRRALVPAAVLVLNAGAYAILGLVGLSLLGRYLFLAGAMLSLFAAVAVFGWVAIEPGPLRTRWRAAGVVVIVGIIAFSPQQADRLSALRSDIANRERVQADLHSLLALPKARLILPRFLDGCRMPLLVPNHRPVPELAYWIGIRASEIVSAQGRREPGELFIGPANPAVARLSILDPRDRTAPATPPRGFRQLDRNRSWILYGNCHGD